MNAACCLCVRDCEPYLYDIFNNLNNLRALFNDFHIIFVYDNCTDNSAQMLQQYKSTVKNNTNVIVSHITNNSPHRTVRIANARNKCLELMKGLNIDFHFVIDADNVNTSPWNLSIVQHYLTDDRWDSISFNRRPCYYDIWALLYDDYKHHCWGYFGSCDPVVSHMQIDISLKLRNLKSDLYQVYSAFNGFAIYRTERFKGVKYDGLYKNFKPLLNDADRYKTQLILKHRLGMPDLTINDSMIEHCEHLYYHITSKAKIYVSKHFL